MRVVVFDGVDGHGGVDGGRGGGVDGQDGVGV